MIGQIKYIANVQGPCRHEVANWDEFVDWALTQKMIQFDIETNVTEWWCDKTVISYQFGSCTYDRVQWFFQASELNEEQFAFIKWILESQTICKLIHNVTFEYVVMRFLGVILENVYDTMLGEKVIKGGSESEEYSLADLTYKYLRIIMNKDLQTSFGDNIITEAKIEYGITDVAFLDSIRILQISTLRELNLLNVIALENESVLAFGDITYEGMILDTKKWRENIDLAQPVLDAAKVKIDSWFMKEPYRTYAIKKGYISSEDRVVLNYGSTQQKAVILQWIFPDIIGASQPVIKAYIRDHSQEMSEEHLAILVSMQVKDNGPLQAYVIKHFRDKLIEHEFLIPANTVTINWNSPVQALDFLQQTCLPKLKGTGKEERDKFAHPILDDLEEFKTAIKLITMYGESFIQDHLNPDGKIRTSFNQVLTTGRVSSSKPNMQNIVVNEAVGTRYRNAFICEEGWEMVDGDYVSQELVIIAYISKDPVWMEAIETGKDLHSVCAELVYGKIWKEAADADCAFYTKGKQKCKCKRHKVLRDGVKTINFGLAYGMSEIKLSGTLKITRQAALNLIDDFFRVFPKIKATLTFLGHFGLNNGYIITLAPFFRRRTFPHWSDYRNYIDAHIQEVRFIGALGDIERASKNHPIQGTSADIVKTAMVIIRNYIRDKGLRDMVKFQAQVHDQVTTKARLDYSKEWNPILNDLMIEAGKVVIPTGILKAEVNNTPVWTK